MNRKIITLLLASIVTLSASAADVKGSESYFSDTLLFRKKAFRNIIRLSPNPTVNGTVSINSMINEGKLQVYIFDLSGTLMHQLTLSDKEKYVLRNLKKGTYVYDVFKYDESIDSGRIIVK